jgi:hypothetical protein
MEHSVNSRNKAPERNLIHCFSPESYELNLQAGLLACPVLTPSRLSFDKQWQSVPKLLNGLTAAGTAPVFHGVPFSFYSR